MAVSAIGGMEGNVGVVVAAADLKSPYGATKRIQALDAIRGLSILGILAVNADGFAGPSSASLNPATWLYPNVGWTAFSYWVMDTFFHDKFVLIFSMLFGVSLFLVGGERSDAVRSRILIRRLIVLLGFAMLHGFGVWWGDILSLYAVTGFAMSFFRSLRPTTLLLMGTALYVGTAIADMPRGAFPFASNETSATSITNVEALDQRRAKAAQDLAKARSGWAGAYRVNVRQYWRVLSGYRHSFLHTLGLMMIGLSLFKSGFLAGRSTNLRYVGIIAIGLPALALLGWILWRVDVRENALAGLNFYVALLSPLVSLGYGAGIVLLLRSRAAPILAPLAATGRMAFTNYLTQSLIMTTIFFGGRGAMMGRIDRPALWILVVGIWILQLTWSSVWLSRFDMGPFEWVWRCLTLGRLVPIRQPVRQIF